MQKYEYRCQRCMIIEERWILNKSMHTESVPCRKCGGEAEKIISGSNFKVNDYNQNDGAKRRFGLTIDD